MALVSDNQAFRLRLIAGPRLYLRTRRVIFVSLLQGASSYLSGSPLRTARLCSVIHELNRRPVCLVVSQSPPKLPRNDTACVLRPKSEEGPPHKVYPHSSSLISYHSYTGGSASFFDSAFEDSGGRSAVDSETEAATSKLLADSAEAGFFSDYSQQNIAPAVAAADHVDLQPKPVTPRLRLPNPSLLNRAVRQPSAQLPLNELQVTGAAYYPSFTEMGAGSSGSGVGAPQAFLPSGGYPSASFQQQPLGGGGTSGFSLPVASSSFVVAAPPSTAESLMLMHPMSAFSEASTALRLREGSPQTSKLLPIDSCLALTSTPIQPSRSSKLRRSAKPLNPLAVQIMEGWYTAHQDYPYPSQNDKQLLARAGEISTQQVRFTFSSLMFLSSCNVPLVSSWFANRRSRRQNTRPKQKIRKVRESIRAACMDIEQASNGLVKAEEITIRLLALIDDFYQSN
nr:unnamed protein product [Spirometra erinaceieuropaei]